MNLPLILSRVCNTARSIGASGLLIAKKHAPEILIGSGIVGYGITVVTACKGTIKTQEVLEKRDKDIEFYTGDDSELNEKKIKEIKASARRQIVKAYLPAVTMGVASTACVLGGYRVLNGRYVATAAAYKLLETSFDRYRSNVVDEFGKDVDWRMANDIKADDLKAARDEQDDNRAITADNQRKKLGKKKAPKTAYSDVTSQIFDQYSEHWRRNWTPDQVWDYLVLVQEQMNDQLQIRKHVFLNEVYDRLGLPRTPAGAVTGWILTRDNPNCHIDFGLDDIPPERLRAFLGETINENIWIRLHFNHCGLIYNMIDKTSDLLLRERHVDRPCLGSTPKVEP